MINVNEIRMGNMITYYPTGKLVTIDYDHVKSFLKNPEEYNPIPLTPELLQAAGFEETEEKNWRIPLSPFQLHLNEAGVFQYLLVNAGERSVDSVHQLQNLYYALTNEELHIQLTV